MPPGVGPFGFSHPGRTMSADHIDQCLILSRPVPDWTECNASLRRRGVTLQLLWLEYKAAHPEDSY